MKKPWILSIVGLGTLLSSSLWADPPNRGLIPPKNPGAASKGAEDLSDVILRMQESAAAAAAADRAVTKTATELSSKIERATLSLRGELKMAQAAERTASGEALASGISMQGEIRGFLRAQGSKMASPYIPDLMDYARVLYEDESAVLNRAQQILNHFSNNPEIARRFSVRPDLKDTHARELLKQVGAPEDVIKSFESELAGTNWQPQDLTNLVYRRRLVAESNLRVANSINQVTDAFTQLRVYTGQRQIAGTRGLQDLSQAELNWLRSVIAQTKRAAENAIPSDPYSRASDVMAALRKESGSLKLLDSFEHAVGKFETHAFSKARVAETQTALDRVAAKLLTAEKGSGGFQDLVESLAKAAEARAAANETQASNWGKLNQFLTELKPGKIAKAAGGTAAVAGLSVLMFSDLKSAYAGDGLIQPRNSLDVASSSSGSAD